MSGVDRLRQMLQDCKRAVVFTGAGISTESGIPDFRSPGGVWDKYKPIFFQDFLSSEEMRRESWRRKFASDAVISEAAPNRGHLAVAQLVKQNIVGAVITQNIDNLHQNSGVPDHSVIELHGNATYASCLDCHKRFELAEVKTIFEEGETLPLCDACDGIVKTATISFGQSMPEDAMLRAEGETLACDLFIVLGSSLVVYPAAGFPMMAKQNGAKLVIINRDPTDQDALADLVIHESIGETMSRAVGLN